MQKALMFSTDNQKMTHHDFYFYFFNVMPDFSGCTVTEKWNM